MTHDALVDGHRSGFAPGFTVVTREGGPSFGVGLDFGICVQTDGRIVREWHVKEAVWVLLDGEAEVRLADRVERIGRRSLFEEGPSVLHLAPETWAEIQP